MLLISCHDEVLAGGRLNQNEARREKEEQANKQDTPKAGPASSSIGGGWRTCIFD